VRTKVQMAVFALITPEFVLIWPNEWRDFRPCLHLVLRCILVVLKNCLRKIQRCGCLMLDFCKVALKNFFFFYFHQSFI